MGSLINQYIKRGKFNNALSLYQTMSKSELHYSYINVPLDGHTYVDLIKVCIEMKDIELGHQIHINVCKLGLIQFDVFVGSTLVSIYGRLGAISEAVHVFCALSKRNVVSWTAIISAYVEVNQAEKALQLFWQMQTEVVSPDKLAAVAVFQACCSLAENSEIIINSRSNKSIALEIGQALRDDTCTKDFSSDVFLNSSLLNMYSKCGAIMEAECMFGSLSQPNIVLWSTMLTL